MNNYLPVMLLKGFVILPNQEIKLEVNNSISEKVINLSMNQYNNEILVVSPINVLEENPEVSDLPIIGVVGKIKSRLELSNGNTRIIINGLKRVKVINYMECENDSDILMSSVSDIEIKKHNAVEETALKRKLVELLKTYVNQNPTISNSILNNINGVDDLYNLTDIVTSFIPFPLEKKILYIEEINPVKRANALIYDIALELEILKIDEKIDEALQEDLEKNQKEFILNSKLKEIKKELGEVDEHETEVNYYKEKINDINASEKTKNKLYQELKKFDYTPVVSPESSVIRTYLDTVLSLPWGIYKEEEKDLKKVKDKLNKSHYALDKIKERIIEHLAVLKRNPNINSPIICLVGPPGVGKTSLAIGIANSLNKEYYKISVGGLNDSSELVGHRRTYLGSNPGKIIQALKKCNSSNPLIIIDEVDKIDKNYKNDPTSALLDILDPSQNTMFIDNYIEEPFDLSKVMFILTANDLSNIPKALEDRLEVIEINSYTEFEKLNIVKKYIIPKAFEMNILTNKDIKINDNVINFIINSYTKEAGVRELERCINTIIRKIITLNEFNNNIFPVNLNKDDVVKLLGKIKYNNHNQNSILKSGIVNGLAYSPNGGLVMPIETCFYDGSGKVITTGMIGKTMDESIKVAISYIRNNKDNFKINDYYFDKKDIHIHALEGAIKKDGPSAGITITTSLISLMLNKIVSNDIAMTGEISLNGNILEIGGLKEKILGAFNSDVKKVYIPYDNKKDLDEIPNDVLNKINIIPVKNYQEIYDDLFI